MRNINKEIENTQNNINEDVKRVAFEVKEKRRFEADLINLANSGNIFAKYQQNYDRTGLKVNLEALLHRNTCEHVIRLGAVQIEPQLISSPQIKDGFKIQEIVCGFCGKTLEIKVVSLKGDRSEPKWSKGNQI